MTTVADLVADRVRLAPDALAVAEPLGGTAFTYRELWERAGWLAAELAGVGIRRGDLVVVDLPRRADLVVAFLGVVRAGAAYLPLDEHAPAGRVTDILGESRARVVVCPRDSGRLYGQNVRLMHVPQAAPADEVPRSSDR
jgi:non-ribosomal peptide synthetase component F